MRAVKLLRAVTARPAHSRPMHPTWTMALQQIMRCDHPQGKLLFLQAAFPAWDPIHVTVIPRAVEILGFSAGSLTGLALHAILCEFECFSGPTKVAAIAVPPELMTLPTGDRTVRLIHCIEDRLCVWKPRSVSEVSYKLVLAFLRGAGKPDTPMAISTLLPWTLEPTPFISFRFPTLK